MIPRRLLSLILALALSSATAGPLLSRVVSTAAGTVVGLALGAQLAGAATISHRVTNNDSTDNTSYTSNSFTPSANDLIVVVWGGTGTSVGNLTPSSSEGTGFDLITSAVKNSSADVLAAWVATSFSSAVSQTVTISISGGATGSSLSVLTIASMSRTGSSAIKQSAKTDNEPFLDTSQVVFSATTLTGNAILGVVFSANNPPNNGLPTSFSSDNNSGYATPETGKRVDHRNSGHTQTTITWSNSTLSAFCNLGVEFDTTAASSVRDVVGAGIVAFPR